MEEIVTSIHKMSRFFAFIVSVEGVERVVMFPNSKGDIVPLIYTDKESITKEGMREIVQKLANEHKVYFELREYQMINEDQVEMFYPDKGYMV